jgi:3',5'-cyclic AMP phosphodiesterase CpdA
MKDNISFSLSSKMHARLLYNNIVLASSFSLLILSLLFPAHIVMAQEGDDSSLTTTSPSKTSFNFATAGDWDCQDSTKDTVNNIEDKNPELVLALGDFTYHGDPVDCWFDIIQPIDSITKIALGNHDVGELEALMSHFGLTEEYYSFDFKNVHFIALGTEQEYLDLSNDIAKEQLAFVKNDLEKASANPNIDWIIPFFHRVMYPDCQCGIVDEYDHNLVDVYHPLFEKYGVNLVLQGHAHTYERTYPLRFNSRDSEQPIVTGEDSSNNYRSQDGLVIATVGTAGADPTRLYIPSELTAFQETDVFGFLNVDVSSDGTTLVGKFYDNADGEIKDTFTITK